MKREIKFRAWDETRNLMGRVDAIILTSSHVDTTVEIGKSLKHFHLSMIECVLMQFTGLKDKNGKEIYEGDIVKLKYGPPYEVKYINADGMFGLVTINQMQLGLHVEDKEIIGNIWETPELIK